MEQLISLRLAPEKLFTKEEIIFEDGLSHVDPNKPTTVILDADANFIVQDGNHRAVKALLSGELVPAELIGFSNFRASEDPYYHLVNQVRIV